tara:strand:- start:1809 stop:2615 length:807 start_codon:yes stop_codon:yes gene_type:complete
VKNVLTTKQIRSKYDPDTVLKDISITYEKNIEKLRSCISHKDSPVHNYNTVQQLSFLESNKNNHYHNHLINELLSTLKDSVYFMGRSKKDRLNITQKMRAFYSELLGNYLERINMIIQDPELLAPKQFNDPIPKHKGISFIFDILTVIKKDLEAEYKYRKNMPRAGHLTGLQIAMGKFFTSLKIIGFAQKDQITIVQNLFNTFNVDWKERGRDNIKISLQNPALEYHSKTNKDIKNISNYYFPKSLGDNLISSMIEQAIIFKKRIRRF